MNNNFNIQEIIANNPNYQQQLMKSEIFIERYQRLFAEYDNYRKRTANEKEEIYDNAIKDIMTEFAPVIDDFERAINSVNEDDPLRYSTFFKGYYMIFQKLKNTLEKLGIEEIGNVGDEFDSNLHEAIADFSKSDLGETKIIEVLSKGYKYNNRIIRYAKVIVAN